MADEDRWLTTREVGRRLSLSVWTVRRMLEKRTLKGSLISRRGGWRVSEAALADFLAARSNRS